MNSHQIGENAGVVWRALHDRKHERNVFYPLFGSPQMIPYRFHGFCALFLRVYAYLCAALDGMPVKYRKVA